MKNKQSLCVDKKCPRKKIHFKGQHFKEPQGREVEPACLSKRSTACTYGPCSTKSLASCRRGMSNKLEALRKALASKSKASTSLTAIIEKLSGKLRMAEASAADEADKKKPRYVPAGTHVAKVWPGGVQLADEVTLHGHIYDGDIQLGREPNGSCYRHVHMTGDPEKDRWRGVQHDLTGPTFIWLHAAKRWNRLAKAMNRLLEMERVAPSVKCRCRG